MASVSLIVHFNSSNKYVSRESKDEALICVGEDVLKSLQTAAKNELQLPQ